MTAASPTATSHETADDLLGLLRRGASRQRIATHLDGLTPYRRLEQVLAVQGRAVGDLYEAVAGGTPLTFEEIAAEGETGTVILEGRNSLPAFSRFQKRFARLDGEIIGYNHQTMSPVTGPGYFVLKGPSGEGPHPDELYFDYTVFKKGAPPPKAPPGWPAYRPNDGGLSRLVYMGMKDYCRRVAIGVLVGKAYKKDRAEGNYFTLTAA